MTKAKIFDLKRDTYFSKERERGCTLMSVKNFTKVFEFKIFLTPKKAGGVN